MLFAIYLLVLYVFFCLDRDNNIPADISADRAAVAVLLEEWLALDESTKIRHTMEASFRHTMEVFSYLIGHLPT